MGKDIGGFLLELLCVVGIQILGNGSFGMPKPSCNAFGGCSVLDKYGSMSMTEGMAIQSLGF